MVFRTKYGGMYPVTIKKGTYQNNNRLAVELLMDKTQTHLLQPDHDDMLHLEPVATVTVNLVNQPCQEGHGYIKDYSENEGMLQFLTQNGLAEVVPYPPGADGKSGFITCPYVRFTFA